MKKCKECKEADRILVLKEKYIKELFDKNIKLEDKIDQLLKEHNRILRLYFKEGL